jgi:hypothetical protein
MSKEKPWCCRHCYQVEVNRGCRCQDLSRLRQGVCQEHLGIQITKRIRENVVTVRAWNTNFIYNNYTAQLLTISLSVKPGVIDLWIGSFELYVGCLHAFILCLLSCHLAPMLQSPQGTVQVRTWLKHAENVLVQRFTHGLGQL